MIHDGKIVRLVTIRISLLKKTRKQIQFRLMLYENIVYVLLKHEETQNLFAYAT